MDRPVPRLAVATAICALMSGACGGDDEGESGRTETFPAEEGRIRVVAREYRFDPAHVVLAGGPAQVNVALDNRGTLAHNLKLFKDGREVAGTPTFQGGQTRSAWIKLQLGSYRMVCTVGDHEELGMVGTLEVEP
jgi:plastocyanin